MGRAALGRGALVLVAVLVAAACTRTSSAHAPTTTPTTVPTAPTVTASAACPATADVAGVGERQGVGSDATLWALMFPAEPTLTAGQEIKIAWRMTGSGPLAIRATGPGGRVTRPVWGPEAHSGSNWIRPGDEWGTGWVFPAPGCWTVEARRSTGSGHLAFRVA